MARTTLNLRPRSCNTLQADVVARGTGAVTATAKPLETLLFQASVHSRGKVLPVFAFAKPARPPRHGADRQGIQARRAARSLPHEALLWLAPYIFCLIVILTIGY